MAPIGRFDKDIHVPHGSAKLQRHLGVVEVNRASGLWIVNAIALIREDLVEGTSSGTDVGKTSRISQESTNSEYFLVFVTNQEHAMIQDEVRREAVSG